jgi:hypothetical protein
VSKVFINVLFSLLSVYLFSLREIDHSDGDC